MEKFVLKSGARGNVFYRAITSMVGTARCAVRWEAVAAA
jgi:hypothetical protein